jgi:transcriptional regulator with XRE-family HTH domain
VYKERVESCGQRIAKALDIRGMKQSELCRLAKVPKSSLSLYLSGAYEPKQNRVYDIAKALNVDEAWLMGYDVPMERRKTLPDESASLTEEEREWLDLFRRIPKTSQPLAHLLLDSVSQLPEERQQMALEMVRIALKK